MARVFRSGGGGRGGGGGVDAGAGRGRGGGESRVKDILGEGNSEVQRTAFEVERQRLAGKDRTDDLNRIEAEERPEKLRLAQREAERAASGERVPGKFSFEVVSSDPDAQGESAMKFKLNSSVESPIDLELYVPELSGLNVRREKEVEGKKPLTGAKVDKDGVLRIPAHAVGKKDVPESAAKQLLKIFEAAIAAKSHEGVAASAAEKKLDDAKAGMYEESSALKRRAKYKTLELAVVAAREKKDAAVQKRMVEIVGRIKEAEMVDLFAPFGGEEGWKKHYEAEQAAARVAEGYLFAPKKVKKEEHGHGEHGGEDDHAHHAAPKEDGLLKSFGNDLKIRNRAIDAHFAAEKAKIESDPASKKSLTWLKIKHSFMKYPGAALKATGYVAGVAAVPMIGVGLSLWDLTGLPGLKIARTELANWANWVLETLHLPWEIPTGEKKGKGGGGGGHGGGH